MATLRAIKDHVIFQFNDSIISRSVTGGNGSAKPSRFSEVTEWGFEISNYDDSTKKPRWGIVVSAGPKAYGITTGDLILIEALKWTSSCRFNSEDYWRTNMDNILLVG